MIERTCAHCGQVFQTTRRSRRYCGQSCANSAIALRRERAKRAGPKLSVWSCGGGVQSSAIAALIIQGRLPKPDRAVFVDCGWEKRATLEHVHQVLKPELLRVGVELTILPTTDYSDTELFDSQGHLLLPAYRRNPHGRGSKLNTHCSGKWKKKVVMRWLRQHGARRAEAWIGISIDEVRRAKGSASKWYTLRYPLLELGMDRLDCHRATWDMGWPRVQHSACVICPKQNNSQWMHMREHCPEDWERAVAVDRGIRERHPDLFLHRSMIPLDEWAQREAENNARSWWGVTGGKGVEIAECKRA